MGKATRKAEFAPAFRSFQGYLEGTEKSLHTVKSYRLDLLAFEEFLRTSYRKQIALDQVGPGDLDAYHDSLKSRNLKTNTRRRMLMTVRRFLSFLHQRKKIPVDLGRTLLTPLKLERIPVTVSRVELLAKIRELPHRTVLEARNRALLWTLSETGCLVSELGKLRFDQLKMEKSQAFIEIEGKSPRKVPVDFKLAEALKELESSSKKSPWIFVGHNKFGSLGSPISSRGVEHLVQYFAHKAGFKDLTPRIFRHSAVLYWFQQGILPDEVQKRLGLKSQYAFRAFQSAIKSSSEKTSSSQNRP